MISTLTMEQQLLISTKISEMRHLSVGLGDVESACSIAAINLALTGELTDKVPDCMSRVIGEWIIIIQDSLPASIRNSSRYTDLLPQAAGTGRDFEQERLDILLNWMWTVVLPSRQAEADRSGHGGSWKMMCEKRTRLAAHTACSCVPIGLLESAISHAAASAATDAVEYAALFCLPVLSDRHHDVVRAQCVARAAVHSAYYQPDWDLFNCCDLLEKMILL